MCRTIYPATTEYFSPDTGRKAGLHRYCKSCRGKLRRDYYKKYRTITLKQRRLYVEQHKEQVELSKRAYSKTIKGHIYNIWKNMNRRCSDSNSKDYKNYGGRGIRLRFKSFSEFYAYVTESLKVDPRGLTIDRIDNDGHYEEGNVRFVTQAVNNRNRRRKEGENHEVEKS